MKSRLSLLLLLVVAACDTAQPPLAPGEPDPAEDIQASSEARQVIVVLSERENPHAVARDHGITATHVYTHALTGFAGRMNDLARSGLLRDYRVVRVRPDQSLRVEETQTGATWGLDRIDQRGPALNGSYTYNADGSGVTAYIVDSGIHFPHAEFGTRASPGFDAFGEGGADCNGHGTHVAGTVGGRTYGVAKAAKLVSVRVLDCAGSGTTSTALAGIEWILANGALPAVVNMSFAGPADDLLDDAVRRLHQAGFVTVTAAGNYNTNACNYSPARAAEGITVAATGPADERAGYSNYGACVDWFAPGSSITSAAHYSTTATTSKSGTSMAAPHVTGAAALYLQQHNTATPQQVIDALALSLTRDVVADARSSGAHLLFSAASATPGLNAEPRARMTASCTRLTCTFQDLSTDPDGSIVSRSWNFGDAAAPASGSATLQHTYAAGDVYRVTLVVTDDHGLSSTWAADVPVGLLLETYTYRRGGRFSISLAWRGAATSNVLVYVNGARQATTQNTGAYSFTLRARGTYSIRVCESGSAPMCSADKVVVAS